MTQNSQFLWARRRFLGAATALPLIGCVTGTAPVAHRSYSAFPKIIDCSTDARPHMANLQSMGVRTVFRYYASGFQAQLPNKRLKPEEARELIDAGFSIGVVYQFNNDKRENIHGARGRDDALFALDEAGARQSQPRGSAIYFGMDGDWADSEAPADIAAYFTAIKTAFDGSGYKVGVYGSGVTCRRLLDAGLVDYTWLAFPRGWSGAKSFWDSGDWRLFQMKGNAKLGSLPVDMNMLNPLHTDFGQWGAPGADYAHAQEMSQAVSGARAWIARRDAVVRTAPQADAGEVENAPAPKGEMVRVFGVEKGWAGVDVRETGAAVGFLPVSALTSDISVRPQFNAPDA